MKKTKEDIVQEKSTIDETNLTEDTDVEEIKNDELEESDKDNKTEKVQEETKNNSNELKISDSKINFTYHLQEKPRKDFFEENKIKVLISLLVIVLLSSILIYNSKLKPVQKESEIYHLMVEEGDYFETVLIKLSEDSVIKSKGFAKLYSKFNALQSVAAGTYDLDKSWDTKEIINYLNTTVPHDDILVKFPEGSWAKDVAEIISNNFSYKEKDIITLWNDKDYIKKLQKEYDIITDDVFKNAKDKKVLLEGYLYPDTYSFDRQSTLEDITSIILDNTQSKFETIKKDLNDSDLNFYEVLTLSSIVMYEAGLSEDQQIIAGVFKNRLKIDMALGSSVTVCYTLYDFDDWEECETYDNLQIDSPYNTYVYPGLPIGPILNPSLDALENTINHKDSDYYYFVADAYEGGDGTIYYSKTLKEHEKKVNELSNR